MASQYILVDICEGCPDNRSAEKQIYTDFAGM